MQSRVISCIDEVYRRPTRHEFAFTLWLFCRASGILEPVNNFHCLYFFLSEWVTSYFSPSCPNVASRKEYGGWVRGNLYKFDAIKAVGEMFGFPNGQLEFLWWKIQSLTSVIWLCTHMLTGQLKVDFRAAWVKMQHNWCFNCVTSYQLRQSWECLCV